MLDQLAHRRVLMLQGPMGPFFSRVARHLRALGCTVTKVNLNAGDHFYYRGGEVIPYRGAFGEWPAFVDGLLQTGRFDALLLFGDCRPYHRVAIERARAQGVEVHVFEEGYLRPDFVTLERDGVAGNSPLPKDPTFYWRLKPTPLPKAKPVGQVMPAAACYATGYALANRLLRRRYPHYRHHRDIHPWRQAALWARGGVRRALHTWRDRHVDELIAGGKLSPFFLVPLQVHLDSQIQHCRLGGVEAFIRCVVASFAAHAPPEASLVFKHHPLDRPYRDYTRLLEELQEGFALAGRVLYVDVINLPAALRAARGVVVINSTVGLSAIHHNTPVKCMGTAVYDMEGMTFQGPLDEFWRSPGKVDGALYERFRWWLRTNSQINGTVWKDLWLDPG